MRFFIKPHAEGFCLAGRGVAVLRHWCASLIAAVLLLMAMGWSADVRAAGDPATGSGIFNNAAYCVQCHLSPPEGGRLNAANNPAFLQARIDANWPNNDAGNDWMGQFKAGEAKALSAADVQNITAYIGQYVVPTTANKAVSVGYNSGATAINLSADITVGTPMSIAIGTAPAKGSTTQSVATVAGSVVTTVNYTPTNGQYGVDTFTYTVTNNAGTSVARTVTVTIDNPPAPTNSDASVSVSYNTAQTIDMTPYLAGVYTSIAVASGPSHGTAQVSGTNITYTPAADYIGADSFTYTVTGPGGTSAAKTVTIDVVVPPPPTASNRSVNGQYNTATQFDMSSSVSGVYSSLQLMSSPSSGTATLSGNVITYTPTAGFAGTDTLTYRAVGPGGNSSTATLTITVSLPTPPTASAKSASVTYQTATAIDLTSSISGLFVSNVTVVSQPAHGTATASGLTVTYTPAAGYIGTDSFTYTATNPGGTSSAATVSITVNPPPPPTAGTANLTVAYQTATAIDLTSSISGFASSIAVSANPAHGMVAVNGFVVTYTPEAGYVGADSFSYTATGVGGTSTAGTVTISVSAPPPPTVVGKTAQALKETATTIDVSDSITGIVTSVVVVSNPSHGTVSVSGSVFTYTPAAGYVGSDSFTYAATNPGGTSSAATISINVVMIPVAVPASMSVPLNTATTLDLGPLVSGTGITGISITANPVHGTVTTSGTRVTYTPVNNYFGADAFSYKVFGNAGISEPAVVTVDVTGRPNPAQNPEVTSIVASQIDAARRFSRAQISNFHSRMESLHQRRGNSGSSPRLTANDGTLHGPIDASVAANPAPAPAQPSGAAYRPAANLGADPAAGLTAPKTVSPAAVLSAVTSSINASGDMAPEAALAGKALVALANAAQTSTLHLNAASNEPGQAGATDGMDVWVAGSVKFGSRNPTSASGYTFTSDGISVGTDLRLSDKLAVGVGVGYARDATDIGIDGTNTRGHSTNIAAYASYQPTENVYIDGLLGFGRLDYRMDRYVAPVNDFARSQRSGDFIFGSLTAGYEYKTQGLRLSPYGRLDVAQHRLDAAAESGAGANALLYGSQSIPSLQLAAGLRAEGAHESAFGWIFPRLRVELQHEFKGEQSATFSYVDQVGGPVYVLPGSATSRNALVLGVGSDILLGRGLTLSLDYQMQRSTGQDRLQALYVKLTKDLDGRNAGLLSGSAFSSGTLGLKVDISGMYDDNVTRSSSANEVFADYVYSMHVSKSWMIPTGENTRLFLNAFAGANRFRSYSDLGNLYVGGDVEWQYRAAGEFDAPIWGVFAQVTGEEFDSELRDGYRYSAGINVRQPLTDRISLFGALAYNGRERRSAIFSGSDWSAKLNADYALAPRSTLYLTGEYRYGDIFALGAHTLANINIAKMFVHDDVFVRNDFYAYRFEGRTAIATLGFNHALGTRDSFDFSWRRAISAPNRSPGLPGIGKPRYVVNQFSIVYLTSF